MTELGKVRADVKQESLQDPASAASNPDLHVWLMESCALCGQALAGNKAVKQHLNRQRPEVMSRVQQIITPRLQQHRVMMEKGEHMSLLSNQGGCPGKALRTVCAPFASTCPTGGPAAGARYDPSGL